MSAGSASAGPVKPAAGDSPSSSRRQGDPAIGHVAGEGNVPRVPGARGHRHEALRGRPSPAAGRPRPSPCLRRANRGWASPGSRARGRRRGPGGVGGAARGAVAEEGGRAGEQYHDGYGRDGREQLCPAPTAVPAADDVGQVGRGRGASAWRDRRSVRSRCSSSVSMGIASSTPRARWGGRRRGRRAGGPGRARSGCWTVETEMPSASAVAASDGGPRRSGAPGRRASAGAGRRGPRLMRCRSREGVGGVGAGGVVRRQGRRSPASSAGAASWPRW